MTKSFKAISTLLIALVMAFSIIAMVPVKASAASLTISASASGTCGTGVYWEYFEDTQTLYIHGSGAITSSPWSSYASSINKIIVGNEITSICKGAFRECQAVTEITLPFIGESKNSDGENAVLGYIFGYTVQRFEDLGNPSSWGYSADIKLSNKVIEFSYDGAFLELEDYLYYVNRYIFNQYDKKCGINTVKVVNGSITSLGTFGYGRATGFMNYKVSTQENSFSMPSNTIWQYSAYDYKGCYDETSYGGNVFSYLCYFLTSYYYYVPSTLSVVNITNTNTIPTAAFNGCENIDTINFYSDVNVMGVDVFQNCDADINYLYDSDSNKYTYTNGLDTFTYTVQNGNATIVGCSSGNEAITVPSSIEEYPVTAIGYKAFADKSQIKSVLLPTTITHIDSYAFYNCTNLENITLGTSLDEIGDYAFYNTALTKVTTPTSLRRIGNYAFANCSALAKFTMRSGVESLGDAVFYNDTQLSDVTLSNTIDAISDFCFYNCSALTEINIPASVIKIGNCAFEKCSNLSMVTVEGNVEYIGKKAFYACKLSSFDFENKLTYLGADSFSLTPITTVDLPNTVTQIGAQAFSDCQLLSNFYVPDSVTIGSNALYNNASNLKVTIRYNTGSIPNKMLYKNKMSIVVMEDGITDIGEYAFAECTELTEITFPQTLKNIGKNAFYKSKLSANITLPQKVTTIGSYAFSGATELSEISVPDSIQTIGTRAFDSNVSVSIYYRLGEICNDLFKGQLVKGIFIGDEIYSIGNNAFANCTNLVELSLPDTISTVGSGCFISSNNIVLTIRTVDGKIDNEVFRGKLSVISTVNLDNSNIGDYAFADNVNLKNVSISAISEIATMTSIGDHSFEGCTSLSKLVLPVTVYNIGSHAFYGCTSLTSINIPSGVTQIKPYTFYNCSSLSSMTLPQTVSSIGEYAFYDCADMISINIPDGVEAISDYTFYGCESLEEIDIADSVTNIGNYAFYGCVAMSLANISDQCVSIGDYAFYNCKILSAVTFPDSLKNIGCYAFASCVKLNNITIGNNIEYLGDSVFYNCTGLYGISFGKGITVLPNQAIGGCYNLESVYIYSPLSHIDDFAFYGAEGTTAYIGYDVYMINFFEENGIDYVVMDGYVYEYKITFATDGGEVICSGFYASGATVTPPADPTKASDNTYTYVFAGWDKEITTVDGHKTYTARFTPVYIDYTVIFMDYDYGTLEAFTYHYGDIIEPIAEPARVRDNTYEYFFAGWDKELGICTGDEIFLATYNARYIDYIIVFKNIDGSIISENTYHYGDAVSVPSTPTKPSDNTFTYTFKGWDKEIVDCNGNATYTATYNSKYIDYTVVFYDYDFRILEECTYHYGDTISLISGPTRSSDNICEYIFAGWDKSVDICTGDMEFVAVYVIKYIEYVVEFYDYDGSWMATMYYHYGDPIFRPMDPTREADETYTYTFAGWDKPVGSCCGNATYNATYTRTYIDYTVVFKDYDGEIISNNTYHYGDAIVIPDSPKRETDIVGSYTFKGWDQAVVNCAGNAIYTATYNVAYTDYTVIFKNYNGDVLSTNTYRYGDTVVVPSAPSKPADETYTYAFIGWDNTVTKCEGNATYTAKFTPTNVEYTVVFKDENGTIISTKTYYYGSKVVVPSDPIKAADNTYTYTFAGWDKEVVDCVADATYTATYTPVYINYTITFTDYDGSTIKTVAYHYGDTIESIANPTRASDETYTYAFSGWDKSLGICIGDITFKATYTPTYINYTVIFKNEDDTVLSTNTYHYGDIVTAPATPTKAADNTYTYTFKSWDQAVVNCAGNATYTATYTPTYIEYAIVFKDYDGKTISSKDYHYGETITVPSDPTRATDNTYTYAFAGWDTSVASTCGGSATYTATYTPTYIKYTVVFKDYDGETISTSTYHYGDEVTVPTAPTKAANNTYTYTFKSWDKEVVACAGDATYTATYNSTYIDYTVIFKNEDGSVISSKTYHYGDTVNIPETPAKAADNTYTYTFAGWNSEVVVCDGEKVYFAIFVPVFIEYTVVFKDWNGKVISSNEYHYGQTVTKPSDPTRESDNTYTYAFAGWDKTVTSCTESTVYTATYSSTYIEYEVVFKNYDGTILSTNKYHYGDTVAVPEAPTKPADESYTYGFTGWDSEVTACSGNKTYTATFNHTNVEYTVVFKDYNGNVISSETYHFGDEVVVPEEPSRNADNTYTYTFKDWGKTVAETCVGDAEYTANYEANYVEYNIKFLDWDGSVIQTVKYHYGDTIIAIADPERESDETYTYTFLSWNRTLGTCTGNASFTAQYESTFINYTVVFKDYDGSVISRKTYHFGDTITIPADPVRASNETYTYTFKDWGSISTSCNGNKEYTAVYKEEYIDYTVTFKDHDGRVISTQTYHFGDDITVPQNPTRTADNTYSYSFAGWNENVVTCDGDATYTATYNANYIDYTVVFKDEDGTVLSLGMYHYGEKIVIPQAPTKASDNTYRYTFAGWDDDVVDCVGNTIYTATYISEYIDYIVIFKDAESGEIYQQTTQIYGSAIIPPVSPSKCGGVFEGWDGYVEGLIVSEDAVFIAVWHMHTPTDEVIENNADPDCTTDGHYDNVIYCTVCEAELSRETITVDKRGHDYETKWTVDVEPTCTEVGSQSHHCTRCDDKTDITEILATGHSYDDDQDAICNICSEEREILTDEESTDSTAAETTEPVVETTTGGTTSPDITVEETVATPEGETTTPDGETTVIPDGETTVTSEAETTAAPADDATDAPEEGTAGADATAEETTAAEASGCKASVGAGIAAAALIAAAGAVVLKKKED